MHILVELLSTMMNYLEFVVASEPPTQITTYMKINFISEKINIHFK